MKTRLFVVSFLFFLWLSLSFFSKSFKKDFDLKVYPDPNSLYFTLGYQQLFADSIYLQLLSDIDYCETPIVSGSIAPSPRCHKGWVYRWTDFMTDLDPRFSSVYSRFGTVMSVLVDDREGARLIFEKGLKYFPKDWVLNYRASYHYLYEVKNIQRAGELALAAYQNGGPTFLVSLAGQLYTQAGKSAYARIFLEEFIRENPGSENLPQVKKRLQEAN